MKTAYRCGTQKQKGETFFSSLHQVHLISETLSLSTTSKNKKCLKDISAHYEAPSSSANCTVPNSLELQQSKALSRTPPFFFVNRCTFLCLAPCPLLWLCPFATPLPPTPSFSFCLPLSFSLLSPSQAFSLPLIYKSSSEGQEK